MKTTIELPDELAAEARLLSAQEGMTLRSLMEEALRREIERRTAAAGWQPRSDLAYGTGGLTDEAAAMTWAQLRDMAMTR